MHFISGSLNSDGMDASRGRINVASGKECGNTLNDPECREATDHVGRPRGHPSRMLQLDTPGELTQQRERYEDGGNEKQLAGFHPDVEKQQRHGMAVCGKPTSAGRMSSNHVEFLPNCPRRVTRLKALLAGASSETKVG